MNKLMKHKFFKGIDFRKNLTEDIDVRQLLAEDELESADQH